MRIDRPEDIGNWIRDRRTRRGWSQTQLGERIGASRYWVADAESGKPTVELHLVLRVRRTLGGRLDIVADDAPWEVRGTTKDDQSNTRTTGAGARPARMNLDALVDGDVQGEA